MQNVSEMSIESLIEVVRGQHLHEYSAEAALEIVDRLSKSEKKDVLDEISNEYLCSIAVNTRDFSSWTAKERWVESASGCFKACLQIRMPGQAVAMMIMSEMSSKRIDNIDDETFSKFTDVVKISLIRGMSQERIDRISDEFLRNERSEAFQIKFLRCISDKRLNAMGDDILLCWQFCRYKFIERLTIERVNQMSNETLTRFYTGPQMEVIQKMSEERIGQIDKDTYLKLCKAARLKASEKVGRLAEFEPEEPKNVETKNVETKNVETKNVETKLNEKVQAEFKPQEESVVKPPVEPAVEYESENGCCEIF